MEGESRGYKAPPDNKHSNSIPSLFLFFFVQAAEFCELHNLSVSKKFAQFTKGGIVIPEQALPICRSLNLVEFKNTKYLGEVGKL